MLKYSGYEKWLKMKDKVHEVLEADRYEVVELLTTVTREYDRVSIHGVRRVLLEEQADALGFRLEKMLITKGASNAEYENEMLHLLAKHVAGGVHNVVFGDIFWRT